MQTVSYFEAWHGARQRVRQAEHALCGYRTDQQLQWSIGSSADGTVHEPAIPYSLAALGAQAWLVGDERGRVWLLGDAGAGAEGAVPRGLALLLETGAGVADIAAQGGRVLLGDMRGRVACVDLQRADGPHVQPVAGHQHLGPIKHVRWQPGQASVFASGSQDGACLFSDLRCARPLVGALPSAHAHVHASLRATLTGLAFHPTAPHRFWTTGTPDASAKLWDLRLLPTYARATAMKRRDAMARCLQCVEAFALPAPEGRRARSATALAIDAAGSRIFVAASGAWYAVPGGAFIYGHVRVCSVYEFLTVRAAGPVAAYASPHYTCGSFFSNVTVCPEDRFLLTGSADGNAYAWDTRDSGTCFCVPVRAPLEVSKTAWAGPRIACISDDLTVSLFRRAPGDGGRHVARVPGSRVALADEGAGAHVGAAAPTCAPEAPGPLPCTPPRKRAAPGSLLASPLGTPPNRTILDFFARTPRP